jgi:hypothetical protein
MFEIRVPHSIGEARTPRLPQAPHPKRVFQLPRALRPARMTERR